MKQIHHGDTEEKQLGSLPVYYSTLAGSLGSCGKTGFTTEDIQDAERSKPDFSAISVYSAVIRTLF
jgi:hypothetical protein